MLPETTNVELYDPEYKVGDTLTPGPKTRRTMSSGDMDEGDDDDLDEEPDDLGEEASCKSELFRVLFRESVSRNMIFSNKVRDGLYDPCMQVGIHYIYDESIAEKCVGRIPYRCFASESGITGFPRRTLTVLCTRTVHSNNRSLPCTSASSRPISSISYLT